MNKKYFIAIAIFFLALVFMPSAVSAQGSNSSTITFTNPIGSDSMEKFLETFLSYIQGIIVIISIIFIVIGGLLYITSAGDEGRMKTAKGAILASMIGLAIGIAAPSLLKEIYNILGGTGNACDGLTGAELNQCESAPSLTVIAMNTLNFLLSIVGILAMLMLIIGGIMYLISAGDEKKTDSAKGLITYSIVGLIVALLSLVIVKQIALLFAD